MWDPGSRLGQCSVMICFQDVLSVSANGQLWGKLLSIKRFVFKGKKPRIQYDQHSDPCPNF